ncbi:MAG TPA: hypothetical protein VMT52_08505, partial [Planctomycetota bacterium]|nr:hypothetical protein [Planctomycetota bacterium]
MKRLGHAMALVFSIISSGCSRAPPAAPVVPTGGGRMAAGRTPESIFGPVSLIAAGDFGKDGRKEAGFEGPFGVSTAPGGRVLVADDLGHTLYVFDREGNL